MQKLSIFIGFFLIFFNQIFFATFVKDSKNLSNVKLSNQEVNDLFNSNSWDFKEIMSKVESFKSLNQSSHEVVDFACEVLKQRDFIITNYLSKHEETCQNLGKFKRFLEIRFNMWIVQSRLLSLLREQNLNFSYNQEKNRFEQIK